LLGEIPDGSTLEFIEKDFSKKEKSTTTVSAKKVKQIKKIFESKIRTGINKKIIASFF